MAADLQLDDAAIYDLLNGPDSPVTALMTELSEKGAAVARERVRVRRTPNRSLRSDSAPPGYTLASIRPNVRWSNGLVYGGIAAAEEPSIFLEYPAEQMHRRYPFLTTALDSLELLQGVIRVP